MPEPLLFDPQGRPVSSQSLLAEPLPRESARQPAVFNPQPEKLKKIFQLADAGDPRELQQLLADIEGRDGHFGGVLDARRRAVTRLPWRAVAATDDALAVEIVDAVQRDILNGAWFRPLIQDLLDAVVKGWSVCTLRWTYGDVWTPAEAVWVDQQMTGATPMDRRIAWRDPADESKLVAIEPYTAVVHVASSPSGPVFRRGIGRALAMLYSLKRLGVAAWAGFIELFGVARPVVSYTPGIKQPELDDLERRIQQWMHGGYMLKSVTMKVEFPEPANTRMGGGDPVQAALARWCDEQASKRIVGQTMTSDQGSSRSQAEVHERVAASIVEADATDLAATITRYLVEPYVRLNFGMAAPIPTIGAVIESSERQAFQVEAIKVMAPLGLRVEHSVVCDLIGLPEPADGAELLEPRRAPPPGAAARRGHHRAETTSEAFARQLRAAGAARGAGAASGPLRAAQLAADGGRRRGVLSRAHAPALLGEEDDGDQVDRDAGDAADSNWRRDMQPFVRAAEDAVDDADSYSDFLRRLKRAEVDGGKFVHDLATTDMQLRGLGDGTDEVS